MSATRSQPASERRQWSAAGLDNRAGKFPNPSRVVPIVEFLNLLECLGEVGERASADDGLGVVEDQVAGDFVAEQFGDYVAGGGEDGRAALDVVGVGGNDVDGPVVEEENSGMLGALSKGALPSAR